MVPFHCYADDTQIYFPLKRSGNIILGPESLEDVKIWMSSIFLNLNEKKTEIIFSGPPSDIPTNLVNDHHASSQASQAKTLVKNLEVWLDKELNLTSK